MDPSGDLRERLLVHFVQGAWRAPLSVRMVAGPLGPIVAAGAADVARARRLRAGGGFALPDAAMLATLRAAEGFADPPAPLPPVPDLPKGAVLFSAADAPVAMILALLRSGARNGLIWKPAPGAAASAHLIMAALGPAAQGALAMVQGDHASGALLAKGAPVVWLSPRPAPEGLDLALSLRANAQRHP